MDVGRVNLILFIYDEIIVGSDALRAERSGDRIPVGARFSARVHTGTLGPTQPLIQWVLGLFPGRKTAGAWR
jgi:hypothetical protein